MGLHELALGLVARLHVRSIVPPEYPVKPREYSVSCWAPAQLESLVCTSSLSGWWLGCVCVAIVPREYPLSTPEYP